MNRVLKAILRPFWILLLPARRKFNERIDRSLRSAVGASMTTRATESVEGRFDEIVVVLDNLVTEVYRLQARIDELTRAVEDREGVEPWVQTRGSTR